MNEGVNFSSSIKLGLQKLNKIKRPSERRASVGSSQVMFNGLKPKTAIAKNVNRRDSTDSVAILEFDAKKRNEAKLLSKASSHLKNLISDFMESIIPEEAENSEILKQLKLENQGRRKSKEKNLFLKRDAPTDDNEENLDWGRSRTKDQPVRYTKLRREQKTISSKNVTFHNKLDYKKRKTNESEHKLQKTSKKNLPTLQQEGSVLSIPIPAIKNQNSGTPLVTSIFQGGTTSIQETSPRNSNIRSGSHKNSGKFEGVDNIKIIAAHTNESLTKVDKANEEFLAQAKENSNIDISKVEEKKKNGSTLKVPWSGVDKLTKNSMVRRSSFLEESKRIKARIPRTHSECVDEHKERHTEGSPKNLFKTKTFMEVTCSPINRRRKSKVISRAKTFGGENPICISVENQNEETPFPLTRTKLMVISNICNELKENIYMNPADPSKKENENKNKLMKTRTLFQSGAESVSNEENDGDRKFSKEQQYRGVSRKELVYDSQSDDESDEEIGEDFYIHPQNRFKLVFDGVVMIFYVFALFYTPWTMAFGIHDEFYAYDWRLVIEVWIDLLFTIDMILRFCTAYVNFDEVLVKNVKEISKHYITGQFGVDFFSAFPFNTIIAFLNNVKSSDWNSQSEWSELMRLLHLLRALRLLKTVSIVSFNQFFNLLQKKFAHYYDINSKAYRLILSFIVFICLTHFMACIFIYLGKISYPNWIFRTNLQNSEKEDLYVSSIYYNLSTVFTIGYGDIVSVNIYERFYNLFLLIVGIMMYSYAISSLSNIVQSVDEKTKNYEKKMSILERIRLKHEKMPVQLYDKISRFLKYEHKTEKKDKKEIIELLPNWLRNNLIYEMYKPIIENFIFFKNFDNVDFIVRVILSMKPILVLKNERLVKEGDYLEEIFFVKRGSLNLEIGITLIKETDAEDFFSPHSRYTSKWSLSGAKSLKSTMTLSKKYSDARQTEENEDVSESAHDTRKIIVPEKQYIKIIEIRRNEHFGDILMFLNKRSPLSVKVKSKVAELFLLKKPDAVDISMSYPKIWRKIIAKSLWNMQQIDRLINKAKVFFYNHTKGEYEYFDYKSTVFKGITTQKTYHFNDNMDEEDIKKLGTDIEACELKSIPSDENAENVIEECEEDEEASSQNHIGMSRHTIAEVADEENCSDSIKGVDLKEYQKHSTEEDDSSEIGGGKTGESNNKKIYGHNRNSTTIKEVEEDWETERKPKVKKESNHDSESISESDTVRMNIENKSIALSDRTNTVKNINEERNDMNKYSSNGYLHKVASFHRINSNQLGIRRKGTDDINSEFTVDREKEIMHSNIKYINPTNTEKLLENSLNSKENEFDFPLSERILSENSSNLKRSFDSINMDDAEALLKKIGKDQKSYNILYNVNICNNFSKGSENPSENKEATDIKLYKHVDRHEHGMSEVSPKPNVQNIKLANSDKNAVIHTMSFSIYNNNKPSDFIASFREKFVHKKTFSDKNTLSQSQEAKDRKGSANSQYLKSKSVNILNYHSQSPKLGKYESFEGASPIDKRRMSHRKFNQQKDMFFRRKSNMQFEQKKALNTQRSVVTSNNQGGIINLQGMNMTPPQVKAPRGSYDLLHVISQNIEDNSLNLNDPEFFYSQYFSKMLNKQQIMQIHKDLSKRLDDVAKLLMVNTKKPNEKGRVVNEEYASI